MGFLRFLFKRNQKFNRAIVAFVANQDLPSEPHPGHLLRHLLHNQTLGLASSLKEASL
jgi:hypothetical protein